MMETGYSGDRTTQCVPMIPACFSLVLSNIEGKIVDIRAKPKDQ